MPRSEPTAFRTQLGYRALAVAAVSLILIPACVSPTLRSTRVSGCVSAAINAHNPPLPGDLSSCRSGLEYSLPKAQVLLTASRQKIADPDVASDLIAAQSAKASATQELAKDSHSISAKATLDAAKAAITRLKAILAAQKAVNNASEKVAKDVVTLSAAQNKLSTDKTSKAPASDIQNDQDAITKAQSTQAADQSLLNSANMVLASAQAAFPKWQEVATITVLPSVPDPSARYVANLDHGVTRDDLLHINVVNGLLNSSTSSSTDQTPNLVIAVADTAITLAGLPAIPKAPTATPSAAPPNCVYNISEVFNPLDKTEFAKATEALSDVGSNITLLLSQDSPQGAPIDSDLAAPEVTSGLVYRVATPLVLSTYVASGATAITASCPLQTVPAAQSVTAVVPDSRTSYEVSSLAGPFTTTNFSLGFSGGMLVDYSLNRPSELAAVANIPVRIAQDIIQIPTQLLQLRVNYDTQATALVNAQTALQQAQLNRPVATTNSEAALVNAQTSLRQAQMAAPVAVVSSQTALVNAQTGLQQAQVGQSQAEISSQTALTNAQTALQQARLAQPTALATSETALVGAETALQQAQIGQSTAVINAKAALVNAATALQQAQAAQPTATVNSQVALLQAHAALVQAEQALQQAVAAQQVQPQ